MTTCPVCGATERRLLYGGLRDFTFYCAPGEWALYSCTGCGSAYLDPRPTEATIGMAYANYFTHCAESPDEFSVPSSWRKRLRYAARNQYLNQTYGYDVQPTLPWGRLILRKRTMAHVDTMVRHLRVPQTGPGKLLDVGCGNGSFLCVMRDLGWEVFGIEPDPSAVEACGRLQLQVRHGVLKRGLFPKEFFDATTLSHVVEHLHEPLQVLENCRKILKPAGVLFVSTPNLDACGHKVFGPSWLGIDSPRHLCLFNTASLTGLLRRAGFESISTPLRNDLARDFFAKSALIERRRARRSRGRQWLRWQAMRARHKARRNPECSEEIRLLAQRT